MPLDDYTPSLILNLLAPLSVVEKVAWFYVSVNDAMRMNVLQSKKQSLHILLNLLHSDMREVVLSKGTQISQRGRIISKRRSMSSETPKWGNL